MLLLHQRNVSNPDCRNFFKCLEDISPFCGDTDTPVLDFWGCFLWVSKPEWAALFALGGAVHVTCSLGFTSGVIPADLLVWPLW